MMRYYITHNDKIFVCLYVRWETLLSTYLSSNRIIDLIQWSSYHQAGVTVLMKAADGGDFDTVKLLLDSGSDVEDKDNVSTRRCITLYMHVSIKW